MRRFVLSTNKYRAETNYPFYCQIFECLNDEEFRKIIAPEEEKLLDESRVKPARL